MTNVPMLEMRSIRKTFSGVIALDDVNLTLRQGEVHILLGENGAGKSTLVKILSGAYQKTGGKIILNGREVDIRGTRHAQELGIGIIYQEFNLVLQLSVAENIFLGRERTNRLGLIDRKQIIESSQKILNDLGVEINALSLVKELGVAQKQLVEVAKALSLDAKLLIMDEPTSALTDREIRELFATIRRLKKQGVAIIYISHRLEELFEIGDRITVLRDGKHLGTYPLADMTKPELIRLMVDRDLEEQFPKQYAKRGAEILRVEGLGRKGVLDNINLRLHRGEVLGIAGLLGSGRTELARALFGVDPVDGGKIFIDGKLQKFTSPRDAINVGLGFLTEDRKLQGLVMTLSVQENVCLASVERLSRWGIMDPQKEQQAAHRSVQELRIKIQNLAQRVIYLSGGNQQKVVMSKWLCRQADILIFDEPTRGIDVGSKVEIYQLMNRLTAEGTAIIMISSELPEILGMSDRIAVMYQGKLSAEFPAQGATQEKILGYALGEFNGA